MSEACSHDCSSCSKKCGSRTEPNSFLAPANKNSNVKKVIGIVSGKGGVGKSLVTSLLASTMNKRNASVAVLDADITGPSIPKVFGVSGQIMSDNDGMYPAETANGTKLMSINLLLEDTASPVVWRGPVIANAVKQFWTDVCWGEVDYMFVDMPPGTGDVPLTVFQSLPVDGIVIVTSPQELVSMIVEKAVRMAGMLGVPILGIVENMSYFECDKCGERHSIFGESNIDAYAKNLGIDTIAKIPITPALAKACDGGKIEEFDAEWLNDILDKIENI
ncbi:MAG: Mrp/NBP35 family ATP-binding protein [Oscillospiraceae bacterium]|nr:Mrp/NBP35 family ATP-binding protein [Oscillospiraceae bacterium]